MNNRLFVGDNLEVLRRFVADESVDLVYVDPPFGSNRSHNVVLAARSDPQRTTSIGAFEDTWRWDEQAALAFNKLMICAKPESTDVMRALGMLLGNGPMLAYLSMMCIRLLELHRVLKDTGSIYLHCDPVASPYLRLILNAVFGTRNFQNEIVWHYHSGGASPMRRWARKHDTILFYSKSAGFVFNVQREPYSAVIAAKRKHLFHPDGKGGDDVFEVPMLSTVSKERLGYPTQKPEALIERIIKASSRPGDVVLDPFCGSGTALVVSQRLDRLWIGVDVSPLAINIARSRLAGAFGRTVKPIVVKKSRQEAEAGADVTAPLIVGPSGTGRRLKRYGSTTRRYGVTGAMQGVPESSATSCFSPAPIRKRKTSGF